MKKSIIAIMLLIAVVAGCFALVGCNKEDPSTVKDGAYAIGVQSGTTGEYYVKGDADWGFDGYANNECKGYANGGLAVQDMLNGKVDFVVIDEAPAKAIADSAAFKGKVKVINVPLTVEEYAFGECESLTRVEYPATVTSQSSTIFNGCIKLTTLKMSLKSSILPICISMLIPTFKRFRTFSITSSMTKSSALCQMK